jgi:hypothetical protein
LLDQFFIRFLFVLLVSVEHKVSWSFEQRLHPLPGSQTRVAQRSRLLARRGSYEVDAFQAATSEDFVGLVFILWKSKQFVKFFWVCLHFCQVLKRFIEFCCFCKVSKKLWKASYNVIDICQVLSSLQCSYLCVCSARFCKLVCKSCCICFKHTYILYVYNPVQYRYRYLYQELDTIEEEVNEEIIT